MSFPLDLLPARPSPFTRSIALPGAERATRHVYQDLGYALPVEVSLYRLDGGQVAARADLLIQAGQALFGQPDTPDARKVAARLAEATAEATANQAGTRGWWEAVRQTTWRQATLLQIMEEIEPRFERAFAWRLRTALGLEGSKAMLAEWVGQSAELLAGLGEDLGRAAHRGALRRLGQAPGEVAAFLNAWGHWGADPLEASSPRWREDRSALLAAAAQELAALPAVDLAAAAARRAAAADSVRVSLLKRRRFGATVQQAGLFREEAEAAHDQLVRVLDAARYWALAAGREATADGRLADPGDVFWLELEELKQMMTGEWSSPEQVRPLVAGRRR